ncbi:phosphate/phosphite/phosphonate ABC transporter substrate-binding protein [Streptomyces gilvosporeus]|uniref:phosphate/phosphite/phosphonate ABC transporter substrate-binding protein n=1 Tax=Streptomyces gilvosporeus TaxID=553510 RepID=UPI001F43D6CD|nr:phosphate/phosphite/phosphonate ABC transporter substrate-binding protein [Streptomyces gilvosporeus]
MSTKLSIGVYAYEHTEALFDGRVTVDGVDATFETAPLVSDIFRRTVEGHYDLAEFGLTYFLRTFDLDDAPFLALPILPNRNFRHSAIFVNTAAGIVKPQDLAGRTVGEFALYGHDAGIWPKGILADEYGVTPDQCRWVIGGTNHPLPAFDWVPQPVPDGVDVRHAEDGQTLGAMLEYGEIDALISVDVPQAVLDGSPKVARLFPDYEAVERDYYRRTGIFPPYAHHRDPQRTGISAGPRTGRVRRLRASQDTRRAQVPRRRHQAAHERHHAVVQHAVRAEPSAARRRLVALRRRREPQGHRHLLALPPRAGPVEATADVRGHLRAGTPRHLSRAATAFRACPSEKAGLVVVTAACRLAMTSTFATGPSRLVKRKGATGVVRGPPERPFPDASCTLETCRQVAWGSASHGCSSYGTPAMRWWLFPWA